MSTLDLTSPDTKRRLQAAWHAEGCTTQHGFPDCPNPDDIIEDIDAFIIGLRRIGDAIEIDALSAADLAEAWHYGCRRDTGSEHSLAVCDKRMRDLIMLDDVPNVVRPMLDNVSF